MTESCELEENETLLEFPCEFPIKAMGKAENSDGGGDELPFDALVVSLIRKHAPDIREGAIKTRPSKNGNFISVTVTITATSKAQLDAIYYDLTAEKRVLMAL